MEKQLELISEEEIKELDIGKIRRRIEDFLRKCNDDETIISVAKMLKLKLD